MPSWIDPRLTSPYRASVRYSEPYHGAVALQRLMLKDAENPELKPIIRAGLARAYAELEEMKRKIAMRPLPKAIDVSKERKARRSKQGAQSFSEPEDKGIS